MCKDNGAFVQGARWGVCVQLQPGDEALGGDLEEIHRFLIRVYFVCATCEPQGQMSGGGERVSLTVLLCEPRRTSKG